MHPLPERIALGTTRRPGTLVHLVDTARELGLQSLHASSTQIDPAVRPLVTALREARVSLGSVEIAAPDPSKPEGFVRDHWLTAEKEPARRGAVAEALESTRRAAAAGASLVVVRIGPVPTPDGPTRHLSAMDHAREGSPLDDPDRMSLESSLAGLEEAAVELACRSLHELCRSAPDVTFCLAAGASYFEVPRLRHLEWILGEVRARNLGYWHVPGRCEALESVGLEKASEWLQTFSSRMFGVTWHDARIDESGLLPETGRVDLSMVADSMTSATRIAVDVAADWGADESRHAVESLRRGTRTASS